MRPEQQAACTDLALLVMARVTSAAHEDGPNNFFSSVLCLNLSVLHSDTLMREHVGSHCCQGAIRPDALDAWTDLALKAAEVVVRRVMMDRLATVSNGSL